MSWLIRILTRSKFSHCAIYDEERGVVIDSDLSRKGVTEYKPYSLNPNTVVVDSIDISSFGIEIYASAKSQLGKPYDLQAIIGFPLGRDWAEDDKWFCSELLAWCFEQNGYELFPNGRTFVSPKKLYKRLLTLRDTPS